MVISKRANHRSGAATLPMGSPKQLLGNVMTEVIFQNIGCRPAKEWQKNVFQEHILTPLMKKTGEETDTVADSEKPPISANDEFNTEASTDQPFTNAHLEFRRQKLETLAAPPVETVMPHTDIDLDRLKEGTSRGFSIRAVDEADFRLRI